MIIVEVLGKNNYKNIFSIIFFVITLIILFLAYGMFIRYAR